MRQIYQLLILGSLAARDMSGYKLRVILENMEIPRHKVTNSAIYPVLKELEQLGDITLTVQNTGPREEKMAHLLPQGLAHLQALLQEPVPRNTKTEAIYRCKIRALPAVAPAVQQQILTDYRDFVQSDLEHYRSGQAHIRQEQSGSALNTYLNWGISNLVLNEQLSQTKLAWIDAQLKELAHDEK